MRPPLFTAHQRPLPLGNQGGFVLVAILMLIALSLVLIVTTSSISQMERKAVSNSTKEEIAKRNALFALEVALAQLQKEAGPDQRVTATADIYNTNGTNVSQPYWTGVWKTFNPDWNNDPARQPWYRPQPLDIKMSGQNTPILRDWSTNATNVVWLVSGATNNDDINPFSYGSNGASGSVVLATGWGTNSNTVSVPLVTINAPGSKVSATNPVPGRYAYWVSDEGVKAKVTLSETNLTNKPISSTGMLVSSLVHYLGGSAPYLPSVITNFGGLPNSADIRTNTSVSNITSLSGLQYADISYTGITNNAVAGDFTVWSFGVLSDVRRGGLKQDLTAAFESSFTNRSNFEYLVYRTGLQDGNLTNNDLLMAYRASSLGLPLALSNSVRNYVTNATTYIDGLRWQSLYNYYNLYKATCPQPPLVSLTNGQPQRGTGIPALQSNNTILSLNPNWRDPSGNTLSYSTLCPSIIADSIIAQLSSTSLKIGTNAPKWFFKVTYYPLMVLYNPYSTALQLNNSSFTVTKSITTTGSGIDVTLTCRDTTGNSNYVSLYPGTNVQNLWPVELRTTNPPNYHIFQLSPANVTSVLYPFKIKATNSASNLMYPGEIRVYGLTGTNLEYASTNLWDYTLFTNANNSLKSQANMAVGNGIGGVSITLTNFVGANPNDIVSLNLGGRMGIQYNTCRNTPEFLSGWPNSTVNGTDLPGIINGTSDNSSYPTNVASNLRISQLSNNPQVILSVTERLKGTVRSTNPKFQRYIGVSSNFPVFMGNSIFFNAHRSSGGNLGNTCPTTETDTNLVATAQVSMINSLVNTNATALSWLNTPVGDNDALVSDLSTNNNIVQVVRDIPIAPMTSLGQFMHLDENYNQGLNNLFPVTIPGMSIGGSMCCVETGPYANARIGVFNSAASPQANVFMDNSFLANETLFDTYFFSTVPPATGFSWGSGTGGLGPYTAKITSNSIATNQPLPNNRFTFYRKNGTNPTVADLQNESKSSANLLIDGAFNVNSTSPSAWKALLTSLNGQTFQLYLYTRGRIDNRYVTNPILRFWSVGRYNPNDPWDGMRSLTDQQVTSLANEIVKQVRARGPFLSMGDFLNRRLAPAGLNPTTNNTMGALQAAIENTLTNGFASDVNNNLHGNPSFCSTNSSFLPNLGFTQFPSTNAVPLVNLNQIVTNSATGIPGYLMQQDLVQAFAPVLTARSDTFVIRVYGEADRKSALSNKTPIPEARAWAEAVVQRLPDYVDQTDPALTQASVIKGINQPLGDSVPVYGRTGRIVNQLNESLGRRFRLVSFRWLNQSEL